MNYEDFIRKSLSLQALPVYKTDIPYIHQILYTMNQAERQLQAFPRLNLEIPITIVDKKVLKR
ncbi:hypothetical protein [Oceanobacillus bengalensis]|uniref:Uncharacterized protein n=1 Tax=Oceanobacillus bengalensis TaxID=1435466 RepID=A0A494YRV5_9BACI|nr:hypothetical protein [Oceanobacillus bengalensis]RKQ12314.1 hypothetical protein D8M05_18525 [Oceanobacillus bengalensis]